MEQINDIQKRIERSVTSRRITESLNLLQTMASMTSAPWSVTDEIERLREAYLYMSNYALDGVNDPSRNAMYSALIRDVRALSDRMARVARARETSSLYFDTVRYASSQPEYGIRPLIDRLKKVTSKLSMASFGGNVSVNDIKERESLETTLFRAVWITFPFTREDYEALRGYLEEETTPAHIRHLLISAILLGELQYPDERRVELIADLYMANAEKKASETAMRALVALVISLWHERNIKFSKQLADKLAALVEMPQWHADARMVSLLMLLTRDTEKITQTMNEEVIPSMKKLRPDIYRKLDQDGVLNEDFFSGENPEWEEMLKKNGLERKLEKLTEMQEQGADVMMAAFAHLKNFPFFNEITNWFMPYHEDHSAVIEASKGAKRVVTEMVSASDFISSSDRYSMLFTMQSLPEEQFKMMAAQIEAQGDEIARMRQAEMAPDETMRKRIANNYVRDLYRFFKLFRRKGEFTDIFAGTFNPLDVELLRDTLSDVPTLEMIAQFYFGHGYWADAIDAYKMLVDETEFPATVYQKMGYAQQKLGNTAEALAYYEKAEMLDPTNRWTWRRIASCLRLEGKPEKAIAYYEKLLATKPDDLNLTLQQAAALAEAGRYGDAMKLYFKVEFLQPESRRALRPIAWTAFLSGDYDTSRKYFDKVMSDSPAAADMMNLGHLEMACGNYRDAIEVYRHAIEMPGAGKPFFAKTMQEDLRHLRAAGVDDLVTGIVIDRLLAE